VATRAGGIPEIVKHETTGLTCNIQSPADLSVLVVEMLKNSKLKNSILKNASLSLSSFSRQQTAEKTLKVYSEITA
jgi:glycosyltransferase involved in cell wall biosynthesis